MHANAIGEYRIGIFPHFGDFSRRLLLGVDQPHGQSMLCNGGFGQYHFDSFSDFSLDVPTSIYEFGI